MKLLAEAFEKIDLEVKKGHQRSKYAKEPQKVKF